MRAAGLSAISPCLFCGHYTPSQEFRAAPLCAGGTAQNHKIIKELAASIPAPLLVDQKTSYYYYYYYLYLCIGEKENTNIILGNFYAFIDSIKRVVETTYSYSPLY
jgi:hypothetical protein